jgi:hypothetical protein
MRNHNHSERDLHRSAQTKKKRRMARRADPKPDVFPVHAQTHPIPALPPALVCLCDGIYGQWGATGVCPAQGHGAGTFKKKSVPPRLFDEDVFNGNFFAFEALPGEFVEKAQ